ncbi:MAG: hypothetical protein ABI843_16010 [Dokdonella sp.]
MQIPSWIWLSTDGCGFSFTLDVGAQLLSVLFLRGRALRLVLIAAVVMAIVAVVSYFGYLAHSNLWPIWLILLSPVALIYIVAVSVGTATLALRRYRALKRL